MTLNPPIAKKHPTRLTMHGHVRTDDYFWLNERENSDVIAYLRAENAYSDAIMAHTAGLQEKLFQELRSRTRPEEESVPYRYGEYFYYERFEHGREYPVFCRRKGSLDAKEQILLDVNRLAEGHEYYDVDEFEPGPDHRYAAFPVDTVGRRIYTLHFVDLDSGEILADNIPDFTGNFEWAGDGRTIFFARQDNDTLRWDRVFRQELGSDSQLLVYREEDDSFNVSVSKSLSERFLYITTESSDESEEYFLDAGRPDDAPTLFLAREDKHEYAITDGDDRFYVVTNDNAENFKLMETPLDRTSKENWRTVVPHEESVLLETVTVFKDHIVIEVPENGIPHIVTIDRKTGERRMIRFDEAVYTVSGDDNYEYDTRRFRFVYESLTTPPTTYDIDLATQARTLLREEEVLGGFDKDDYVSERLFAPSRDGRQLPISLVYRRGMQRNGRNPLLQYAYGAYGDTVYPEFDCEVLSLLDRGFIYALAHVRGGEELGREWYFDGRGLHKKNTFTDFIDCTRFLIAQGYTSPEYTFASGYSAGGLLMAAIVNMAPDLYKGVDIGFAFVDVVTTMVDPDLPLVTSEYDEWGDPNDKEHYDYMLSYSPYDRIAPGDYPHIIATTALHDSQVQFWELAKWVAKLRANKTDRNRLLLHTDMGAGHDGRTGRYQPLRKTAFIYAFFLDLLGISD